MKPNLIPFPAPATAQKRARGAEAVRRVRKALGLTVEQFAARVGYDVSTVKRWQRGDFAIAPDKLLDEEIADAIWAAAAESIKEAA